MLTHTPLMSVPTQVILPEIITLVCSYLETPELTAAARIDHTWSAIALPLLYREIHLSWHGFKMDSLELGIHRNGHFCQRLKAARNVNHWCGRIVGLLRCMPNLTDLDAIWMNADLLESLVYLQKLERLSISRLQGSQSEDNQFFEPAFQGSKQIKELDMADSNQMTDSALVSVTATCPHIQVLIVSGNQCLTHEGLIQWCEQLSRSTSVPFESTIHTGLTTSKLNLAMTELTTVNFANCNRIQSAGFQALFERSHNLQRVNLMSTRVDDDALQVLAVQNRGLETLVLNCCAAVSDQGLQTLLRSCRKLKSVSFLYCNRITVQVFFQNLWKCLDLEELRFSLNARHLDLIERGLGVGAAPAPEQEVNLSVNQPQTIEEAQAQALATAEAQQRVFCEPQLEFMIFGGPNLDQTDDTYNATQSPTQISPSIGLAHDTDAGSPSTVQEYRQRLVLAQLYRQIEQFSQLQILDMRNIHLPLDLASGLARLARLEKLEVLEWTGLERPLGPLEVEWLAAMVQQPATPTEKLPESVQVDNVESKAEKQVDASRPWPSLHQLAFKSGYSMSAESLMKLKEGRPQLNIQLTQVKDVTHI